LSEEQGIEELNDGRGPRVEDVPHPHSAKGRDTGNLDGDIEERGSNKNRSPMTWRGRVAASFNPYYGRPGSAEREARGGPITDGKKIYISDKRSLFKDNPRERYKNELYPKRYDFNKVREDAFTEELKAGLFRRKR